MHDKPFSLRLRVGLWWLHQQIRHTWRRMGESFACQASILRHVARLSPILQQDACLQVSLAALRQQVEQGLSQHHAIEFAPCCGWRVAAHAGMQVSPHVHPGMISLLLVVEGSLQVEQYSLETLTRVRSLTPCCQTLYSGDACVGLLSRHNAHAIRSGSHAAIFFSLRLPGHAPRQPTVFRQLACKSLCGVGLAMSALGCASLSACDDTAREVATGQASDDTAMDAAALYRESLQYLHGDGVPVDRDKAKSLAYMAAGQGYQPAQTLYDEIINGFYDEMTGC